MHSHTFTYILLLSREEGVCRLKNDMEEGRRACVTPVHPSNVSQPTMTHPLNMSLLHTFSYILIHSHAGVWSYSGSKGVWSYIGSIIYHRSFTIDYIIYKILEHRSWIGDITHSIGWVNEARKRWMNEPMDDWMNDPLHEWVDEWLKERIHDWTNDHPPSITSSIIC